MSTISNNNVSNKLYLCLDQGGHASRAALFDSRGNQMSLVLREITTQRNDNYVEHEPQELLDSLRDAATEVLCELGADVSRVIAVGLATQRSSIVCWHRDTGQPLSPVISWQDRRAAGWLEQFSASESRIHAITGLVLSPHYGVSKLRWCLEHLPAVAAAQAEGKLMFGPLATWLANRLCAAPQFFADPANASRTLLWDRQKLDWSEELLQLFDIPRACLPSSVPSRFNWGSLMCGGVELPLQVVTGDQSAALFAFGEPDEGTLYANLGTGAFLQRRVSHLDVKAVTASKLLTSVVYQDSADVISVLEATVNGAGSAVNKFAAEAGLDMACVRKHSAEWLDADTELPLFLNAVSGLGSPWWLADAQSCFKGTGNDEQKMAAVLESIVFLIATNIEAGNRLAGECQQVLVTGGLGTVGPLLQRIADLTAMTVSRAEVSEATVRGVAYLLADRPADWPGAMLVHTFKPQENALLLERYRRWRILMPALEQ
jgi:glycerol kinase